MSHIGTLRARIVQPGKAGAWPVAAVLWNAPRLVETMTWPPGDRLTATFGLVPEG